MLSKNEDVKEKGQKERYKKIRRWKLQRLTNH